ncbi:GNAT family N-acetyltransferase [Staphylococcus caeli]|uniref:Acetyltransferase n=1 Tax=Staphylococcus caeli TaxID=2201815 RepID=A0A1D4GNK4_9STAP|nr:GNAT family N-acetyltransferase [Staphylococcus caeli]SCS26558.1 acetyltransferase [Staphylococcus caeli]SCS39984.1 acetyltransferase [Staphylococcus caeli]
MERLQLSQKDFIHQIATIHETELARQYDTYTCTSLSKALRIEMIEHGLKYNDDRIFIETNEQNEMMGFIWARYIPNERKALIEILFVHEMFRQQHIGTSLKKAVESWAIGQGAQSIESTIAADNMVMQSLNLNMGYQINSVVMSKKLIINNEDNNK